LLHGVRHRLLPEAHIRTMASLGRYMTRAGACMALVMALCGCTCSCMEALTLRGWKQRQQQEAQKQQYTQVYPVLQDVGLQQAALGLNLRSHQQQAPAALPAPTPVQQQQQQRRRLSQGGITLADINVPGIVRVTVPLPPKPPPGARSWTATCSWLLIRVEKQVRSSLRGAV
jgi:hypothetical protein